MPDSLTFFGQAAFLLETKNESILLDPFFTGNSEAPVDAEALRADYILVTHGHGDHIGDTIEIAKRCQSTVVANADLCGWFQRNGVKNCAPLYHGGTRHFSFGSVKAVRADHGSMTPDGKYGGLALGFIIELQNKLKIYFAGDTGLFGDMRMIGDEGIDIALLPIGDLFTMGGEDAIKAVELIRPKIAIPMHTAPTGANAKEWAKAVTERTGAVGLALTPGQKHEI